MPFVSRWSNNYTSTLAANVDATTTIVTVASAVGLPSLTVPAGAIPAVVAVLVDTEIMHVTGIVGNTLTVLRGQDSTVAATHTSGTTVTAVVTRDTLYNNSAPGAIVTTFSASGTYNPDLTFKYHHITIQGAAVVVTIGAPVAGPIPVQMGDEVRISLQIGTVNVSGQPVWNGCYRRFAFGTATQQNATLTANTLNGYSFFWRGGAAINTTDSWVRIH